MTKFIRLHQKNKPFLLNVEGIFSIDEKLKGIGSVIMDFGGDVRECDETLEDLAAIFGEVEVEIIEYAND